jgi:ferrous iron transport protein B
MSCHTPVLDVVAEVEPPVLPAAPGAIKPMRTVALIGPPNSGKSTLFNRLTGLRQKVANYPGVTVEHHSGKMKAIGRGDLTLIDLPGIYSLATYSEDARVAVEVLTGKMRGVPKPDCVLLVLDATHLNRQLMLAAPVFSIGLPTLVLLNMSDELTARGGEIDTLALAKELGHPVALISASENTGLDVIPEFLLRAGSRPEDGLRPVQLPVLQSAASCRTWATQVTARTKYQTPAASTWTRRLDSVLLHRIFGPLIFLAVVIAVFQVVFLAGQPLSDWLTSILTKGGASVASLLPNNWLRLMLLDGVWNGVQAVLVFLPQILLLFLFIGILEDSGYLARAALIADRVMRAIGLNGKAFIPLLSALRVRGAGHHGHAHHREQARALRHHHGCTVHDLLGAAADLHADHRGVHPQPALPRRHHRHARDGDAEPLRSGLPRRAGDGAAAELQRDEGHARAVHPGAAAVSLAHAARTRCASTTAASSSSRRPARSSSPAPLRCGY